MRKQVYSIGLIVLINFCSCRCDKTHSCPALTSEGQSWIFQNPDDSVKFINSSGNRFNFILNSKTITPAYTSKSCISDEVFVCTCSNECGASGYIRGRSDSSINGRIIYFIRFDESTDGGGNGIKRKTLTCSLFDFSDTHEFLQSSDTNFGDSLISSLQLGNNMYSNVYVISLDTLKVENSFIRIWKVYFEKASGIVGFWDKQSQSLYYRE